MLIQKVPIRLRNVFAIDTILAFPNHRFQDHPHSNRKLLVPVKLFRTTSHNMKKQMLGLSFDGAHPAIVAWLTNRPDRKGLCCAALLFFQSTAAVFLKLNMHRIVWKGDLATKPCAEQMFLAPRSSSAEYTAATILLLCVIAQR